MKIIYTCPKCGNDLVDVCLCSNPARNSMYCLNCGFMAESEIEETVRIPYGGNYQLTRGIEKSKFDQSDGTFLLLETDGIN